MSTISEENKAARRKERRRLRRSKQKVEVTTAGPKAADTYPMIYDQNTPRTYTEGLQTTACASVVTLSAKLGGEEPFLNITCYGKRNDNASSTVPYRDFVIDYYIPMDKFSQLGKNKKVTSVDVLNRAKEKKGTLTATTKTFSLLAQRGELSISGDLNKTQLAEHLADKVFYVFNTIVKVAQEPQYEHQWEVQKGVFSQSQVDPHSVCKCTKCGAKFVTIAHGAEEGFPTRGCTVKGESNV